MESLYFRETSNYIPDIMPVTARFDELTMLVYMFYIRTVRRFHVIQLKLVGNAIKVS